MYYTLRGHTTEIVCVSFNPQSTIIATGSMDNTSKLWDVETGQERCTLSGHTAEIVSLNFNVPGDLIITGSFDHDSRIWDARTGQCVHILTGHRHEVSSTQFNYSGAFGRAYGDKCLITSANETKFYHISDWILVISR